MTPYLTVPFSLSDEAWNLAHEMIKPIIDDWTKNSPIAGGLYNQAGVSDKPKYSDEWKQTIVWKEIETFTKSVGLTDGELQFFIYRVTPNYADPRGNPHLDALGVGEDIPRNPVKVRFNIPLFGEDNAKMRWWNKDMHHPDINISDFIRPDGSKGKRLDVRGANINEKYINVGPPEWETDTLWELNKKASFLKTDILHCVDWDGQHLRAVLSARFLKQDWDTIEKYRKTLQSN